MRTPSYQCHLCDDEAGEWCPGHGPGEMDDERQRQEVLRALGPYENDVVVGRFEGGTDPRLALRAAMGEFMKKTDGTTDMPWWLEANYRWWHAGPMGIKRGQQVLPPAQTGARPLLDSDPNMVYVTTDREEAILYATFQMGRGRFMPQLYEVSFDVEPIADDTQPDSQTSYRVPHATVRRIEAPSRRELEGAMREIMEHDENQAAIDTGSDCLCPAGSCECDEAPAQTCNTENPGACEACD